jgi:hypothetical protein
MAILIKTTDFVGVYKLAQTPYTTATLQAFIDANEKSIIRNLLGLELGDLFIASVTAYAPVGARYLALFNALALQVDDQASSSTWGNYFTFSYNHIYESRGMKEIILGIIYCLYVSDQQHYQGQSGFVSANADAAVVTSFENAARQGETRHNGVIGDWEAVQYYISQNSTTYPEFKGLELQPKYSALL